VRPVSVQVTDARYLQLATTLLQRMRLARPTRGIWEAGDIQWWSRLDNPAGQHGQLFWLDDRGEPLAAVIVTSFRHSVQCDVLVLPDDPGYADAVWQAALRRVHALGAEDAGFTVRSDDAVGVARLVSAGLEPAGGAGVVASWLDASRRPRQPALPPGYRLLSRADAAGRAHPLAARNGPDVEQRLRQCSLYRPELDLMAEAPDGTVAGYGLFWADPVTWVGLVEPMRTEEAHRRRGIASHVLSAGLDRLAAHGCDRLKVSSDIGLYLRAGFRPLTTASAVTYARPATSSAPAAGARS
jgi:predicted N-acetyltransferase YhbS